MRAISLAGRQRTDPSEETSVATVPIATGDDVSPISNDSEDEYCNEARDRMSIELSPPRYIQDLA
jgi:hypothetical protein